MSILLFEITVFCYVLLNISLLVIFGTHTTVFLGTSFTYGEANTIGGIGLGRGGGGLSDHSLADPSVIGHHGGGGPDLAHQMDGVLTMVVSYL